MAEAPVEADGHTAESACLNCGAPLDGPYCRMCGQHAHVHRTLGAFFHDLLHGVLHFEGKVWRTLPLLLWRPGKLTREYIDGRRASYLSPIALFLFVVFLTFAGLNLMSGGIDLRDTVTVDGRQLPAAQAEREFTARKAQLERQRAGAVQAGRPVEAIDRELREAQRVLDLAEAVRSDDLGRFARVIAPKGKPPVAGLGTLLHKIAQNPDLLVYELRSNAYKYSWLLIPISVPFVWLLFAFGRRFPLYDHTVFVTYSISFMTIALLLIRTAGRLNLAPVAIVVALYAPVHLYRQLRETYGLTVPGALWRTAVLMVMAALALTIWLVAIFGLILGG